MLDVDHFKRFNDTYGHDAGDYVLEKLGQIIKKTMRVSDISCRYGGEEFMVILPNTDEKGAYAAAEYLRQIVGGEAWQHKGKDLGNITISLGVREFEGSSVENFVKQADMALYQSKTEGRDRVSVSWN